MSSTVANILGTVGNVLSAFTGILGICFAMPNTSTIRAIVTTRQDWQTLYRQVGGTATITGFKIQANITGSTYKNPVDNRSLNQINQVTYDSSSGGRITLKIPGISRITPDGHYPTLIGAAVSYVDKDAYNNGPDGWFINLQTADELYQGFQNYRVNTGRNALFWSQRGKGISYQFVRSTGYLYDKTWELALREQSELQMFSVGMELKDGDAICLFHTGSDNFVAPLQFSGFASDVDMGYITGHAGWSFPEDARNSQRFLV